MKTILRNVLNATIPFKEEGKDAFYFMMTAFGDEDWIENTVPIREFQDGALQAGVIASHNVTEYLFEIINQLEAPYTFDDFRAAVVNSKKIREQEDIFDVLIRFHDDKNFLTSGFCLSNGPMIDSKTQTPSMTLMVAEDLLKCKITCIGTHSEELYYCLTGALHNRAFSSREEIEEFFSGLLDMLYLNVPLK